MYLSNIDKLVIKSIENLYFTYQYDNTVLKFLILNLIDPLYNLKKYNINI